jgi:hypothetical protein
MRIVSPFGLFGTGVQANLPGKKGGVRPVSKQSAPVQPCDSLHAYDHFSKIKTTLVKSRSRRR